MLPHSLRSLFASVVLAGICHVTQAAPPAELNATADAYIAAYTGQKLDTLSGFYTPESLFDDPTSAGFWGSRFRLEGGENIVQAMRENWTLIRHFDFIVRERITYFDRVVLIGTSRLTMDGAMFGATAGRDYTVDLPAVTILQIKDGKILLHLDHYDYEPLRHPEAL
jgi:hypothetical protein